MMRGGRKGLPPPFCWRGTLPVFERIFRDSSESKIKTNSNKQNKKAENTNSHFRLRLVFGLGDTPVKYQNEHL